jgi:hypothetical protein
MGSRKVSPPVFAAILAAHVVIASFTWRDLRSRSADEVRGSKRVWRAASALNTLGSITYFLIGRRSID